MHSFGEVKAEKFGYWHVGIPDIKDAACSGFPTLCSANTLVKMKH